MKENKKFFEKRIGGSFHYQNYWMDLYAWKIRTGVFFNHIKVLGKQVLDFGCGDGSWGKEFFKKGALEVLGVEQSKELCLNSKIQATILKNLRTQTNRFDIVTAITSLNFTLPKERLEIITILKRLLRPNGRLVIIDYLPDTVPSFQKRLDYKEVWTANQWKIFMEDNGLTLEKEIPVNWIDTTLFHYLGGNFFTYYITYILDILLCSMIRSKYKLQIYKKI